MAADITAEKAAENLRRKRYGRIVSTYGFLPKFVWTFSAFQKKNCTAVDVFSQFSELFSLSFELSVSVKTIVVQPKLHYYILLERLIV
jgi:hypothetical protein